MKFRVFDRVMVVVSVDESNIQRHKIVLRLAQPVVPGISVPVPAAGAKTAPAGDAGKPDKAQKSKKSAK